MRVDKRERRLPGLLVEGSSSCPENWAELKRIQRRLTKLKKSEPEKYWSLLFEYFGVLDKIRKALN